MTDWRADPEWRLVHWIGSYWTSQPEDAPLPQAELCGRGEWASVFKDGQAVASWFRYFPGSERRKKKRALT